MKDLNAYSEIIPVNKQMVRDRSRSSRKKLSFIGQLDSYCPYEETK